MAVMVAIGAFSALGSTRVFAAYVVLLASAIAFHALYSCRRCSNTACSFNPASRDCIYGSARRPDGSSAPDSYSDLNAAVAGVPLVAVLALGFYGTYLWSIPVAIGVGVFTAGTFLLYTSVTCRYCTNECPNNRNAVYRAWKKQAG